MLYREQFNIRFHLNCIQIKNESDAANNRIDEISIRTKLFFFIIIDFDFFMLFIPLSLIQTNKYLKNRAHRDLKFFSVLIKRNKIHQYICFSMSNLQYPQWNWCLLDWLISSGACPILLFFDRLTFLRILWLVVLFPENQLPWLNNIEWILLSRNNRRCQPICRKS